MEPSPIKPKPNRKSILSEWIFIISGITLMMYFYYLITWWSLSDYLRSNVLGGYVNSGYALLEIGLQGIIIGLIFSYVGFLIDRSKLSRNTLFLIFAYFYIHHGKHYSSASRGIHKNSV